MSGTKEYVFDYHGFAVLQDSDGDEKCCCCKAKGNKKSDTPSINHQRLLCERFLRGWPESHARHPGRLRCLMRRGLPKEIRPEVWKALLGCEQLKATSSFCYQECLRAVRLQLVELGISEYSLSVQSNQGIWDIESGYSVSGSVHKPSRISHLIALQTLRQIIVDVDRTFPTHRMFMGDSTAAKEGRASLFRILSVYSVYNSKVGYCQGMSYIAGMLLMEMSSEEESFWAMVALFEKPKYLSGYFDSSLQRIQNHAAIFQKLLQQRYPRLAKHFISLDVNCLMFVTPWFMCLFTSMPCWNTVLAIWDLLLLDGISSIFRVALAILQLDRARCLDCTEMGQILPRLLHPPAETIKMASFMPTVWKISVEKWEIESLQAILCEEMEKPGTKRSRRSLEEAENRAKRMKTDVDKRGSSLLQRMRNILTPLSRGILQDTSNIAAPPPPQVTSPDLHNVQYSARRGQRSPALHATRRSNRGRAVPVRCSPRATIIAKRVQPQPTIVTKRVQPRSRGTGIGNSRGSPTNGGRRRGERRTGNVSALREMKSVTSFGSPRTPDSENQPWRGSPAVFQTPNLFRTPRRSGRNTPGSSSRSNQNCDVSPCHTKSLQRMLKRSARAQHSFRTFHTPTPLRKSQVKGHSVISPHLRSPEELQPLKTSLAKELAQLDVVSPQ